MASKKLDLPDPFRPTVIGRGWAGGGGGVRQECKINRALERMTDRQVVLTNDVRGLVQINCAILVRLESVQGDPLDEHFSCGLARKE